MNPFDETIATTHAREGVLLELTCPCCHQPVQTRFWPAPMPELFPLDPGGADQYTLFGHACKQYLQDNAPLPVYEAYDITCRTLARTAYTSLVAKDRSR